MTLATQTPRTGRKSTSVSSAKKSAKVAKTALTKGPISAAQRHQMIREAAFYRAQRRGFENGDPVTDWLEAESEIDETLNA